MRCACFCPLLLLCTVGVWHHLQVRDRLCHPNGHSLDCESFSCSLGIRSGLSLSFALPHSPVIAILDLAANLWIGGDAEVWQCRGGEEGQAWGKNAHASQSFLTPGNPEIVEGHLLNQPYIKSPVTPFNYWMLLAPLAYSKKAMYLLKLRLF